ncbi:hypothetical protein F5Y01DRAFT_199973 [Xylaria sp. FL0043]|nr:hypothetical protein F5Y01DRAFT_199973 [Xylaria sp. FL0043]
MANEAKKLIYCAYCGKGFSRKEHLERHLPHHTNVKPYRCEECQLGFSRRDLLQRHHSTYHTVKDPMEPTPGGVNTTAGRTQIACLNCAQAKTGCDKQSPCTRCREKGLQCEIRYARRSTKLAVRAAQAKKNASASTTAPLVIPTPMPLAPTLVNGGHGVPITPEELPLTIDPRISQHCDSPRRNSMLDSHATPESLPTPPTAMDGIEDLFTYSSDFLHQDPTYSEIWPWGGDFQPSNQQSTPGDVLLPIFPEINALTRTNSEPLDSSAGSTHTRCTSIMSSIRDYEHIVGDMNLANPQNCPALEAEAVIASESGWPIARCNPVIYSGSCPRTAIVHLESLEQSKHAGTWDALEGFLDLAEQDGTDMASVVPMNGRTRDQILAITQTFLHKALETHRSGFHSQNKQYSRSGMVDFLVLPPTKILEYFLRSYVRNLTFFYSLVSSGYVDPNEMMDRNQAATLLVLLMIAQGASAVPREEARALSIGLVETCRLSLFDMIEKNVELCADSTVQRCSLLFTLLGAWSGDKWLMDIAMGQRGMYLSMLKHAGMLESQPSIAVSFNDPSRHEEAWRSWLDQETKNRLVYNWVMVDQELSLFHDTAPWLTISELCAPLPGPEQLWTSKTASQWMAAMQSSINLPANASAPLLTLPSLAPSLHALFQDFLHDNLDNQQWGALTPHRLRLLLHPLQSLLWNLREVVSSLSDMPSLTAMASGAVNKSPAMLLQEDAQKLLQKWYTLSSIYFQANPTCVVSKTNLVLFHLISLNPLTNFPAIEQFARREGCDGAREGASAQRGPYIHNIEESVYHCGQVIRLVRDMPVDRRPIWWSAAVYRALLILWTYSNFRRSPSFSKNQEGGYYLIIDQVGIEDSNLFNYMWGNGPKATPVLSGLNGTTVSLDNPSDVLDYAVKMLEEGISTQFSEGIKRKLAALNQTWNV